MFIFGHIHLQWHTFIDGKLLIDPGSCGVSLDGDCKAAYTILDTANGEYKVEQQRVYYDVKEAIDEAKAVLSKDHPNIMRKIFFEQIESGIETTHRFFSLGNEVIGNWGPFSNEEFHEIYDEWEKRKAK